jgi:hypothetical protein
MNFFKRLLGFGASVDAILGDFHTITNRLRAHAEAKLAEVEKRTNAINRLNDLKFQAGNEASRAANAVRNIEALIGSAPLREAA